MMTSPAESPIDADPPSAPQAPAAIFSPPAPCRLEGRSLTIEPFRIARFGQVFHSESALQIDLSTVAPGRWRVIAVHNFHVEDTDPDLTHGIAGVFLAAQRDDGSWEAPEQFPVECREIGVLAEIEVRETLLPTLVPV